MAKIAFITTLNHTPWGGSEQLWQKTALYAAQNGHNVIILAYKWEKEHPKIKELRENNIKIEYRTTKYTKLLLERSVKFIRKKILKKNIEFKALYKFQPDIICVSQAGTFDIGYDNQQELHIFLDNIKRPYVLLCQNNADVGFVPTQNVRNKMGQLFSKAKKILFSSIRNHKVAERQIINKIKNVHYTSNPLTIKEISIKSYPKSEQINFAVVAALKCSHKGQDVLLEILSRDKWKVRNWKLNLYGKGGDKEYLEQLAKYYKIENRICFCGFVSNMKKLWLKNHIYILPSLGEGLPITLYDAILSGRTAVVTDVGGNSELIIEGKTGFLAEAPTIKLFDSAMERAWQNRVKWQKMGENAFFHAKNKIDITPEKTLLKILLSE